MKTINAISFNQRPSITFEESKCDDAIVQTGKVVWGAVIFSADTVGYDDCGKVGDVALAVGSEVWEFTNAVMSPLATRYRENELGQFVVTYEKAKLR